MVMTYSRTTARLLFVASLGLLFALSAGTAIAGPGKATLSTNKDQLHLSVTVPKPAPSSLIAQLKLTAGTTIISTSPHTAKIDAGGSVVKWLVKNPPPGTINFTAVISPPANAASASGSVTYRKPGDGTLVKITAENN